MKHNILVCRGTLNHITPYHIKKIMHDVCINRIYVVVGYIEQIEFYRSYAYCMLREDCIVGKYEKYVNELDLKIKPLDFESINKVRSFILDIMMTQRRFEERIPLYLSSNLIDHYRLALEHICFWNAFLDEQKIDTVIFSDVPHEAYDNVMYELCKLKGVKTILYRSFFKTDRYFVMDSYENMANIVSERLKTCKQNYFENDERDIQLSPSVESFYIALKSNKHRSLLFREETLRDNEFKYRFGEKNLLQFVRQKWVYRKRLKYHKNIAEEFGVRNRYRENLFEYIREYAFILKKRKSTKSFVRQYRCLAEKPVNDEKYVYYAMHLLPECAVAPLGGSFSDQYLAIKMLSYCVPKEWKVYVKIHPAQVDVMLSINEIEKYKLLGNVRIVDEDTNQFELIKNSMAVATLTGEIAVEALMLDKPSFIFGYTYYAVAPLAFRVETEDELLKALDEIQRGNFTCSETDKKIYFKALEESTVEGMENVLSEIIKKINQ